MKPNKCPYCGKTHKVGFVGTRFAGTDGVSLETAKWAEVFQVEGFECFYFAGEIDRPAANAITVPEAHFLHPEIRDIYRSCFGVQTRPRAVTTRIRRAKTLLKNALYEFIDKFGIELLVPENALTIPLNIPLGVALTQVISETGMSTIAHHHDFYWERQHFFTNAVWDYLGMAFPPFLPSIKHVVINSLADKELSLRTGISAQNIPNVMDFDNPPPEPDAFSGDVREALGVKPGELLILQPTRVVKRKGIEHAIELVSRLGIPSKLVISHASGDEGYDYEQRIRQYSKTMRVDTVFVSDIINESRGMTDDGRKIYTLDDIYPHADLVTYPSSIEGFGNAFLEAVYFKKPIVVNNYAIYAMDIKPKGFQTIELDGYISEETLSKTREVLENPGLRRKMVDTNYEIAGRFFSYGVLRRKLKMLIFDCISCRPQSFFQQPVQRNPNIV